MAHARAVLACVGMLAVTSIWSCRQIVGIEDKGPAPKPSTEACGLPYGTASCASCAAANCCAESSSCSAASPACKELESCLGPCEGGAQCRSQCAIDHPGGLGTTVGALSVCLATHCESECGLACGGLVMPKPSAASACEACVAQNSCDTERACARSAEFAAFQACTSVCSLAIDCRQACGAETDGGPQLLAALGNVVSGPCAAACNLGHDWSCVGKINWPHIKSSTVEVTVGVVDYSTFAPMPDIDVSICDPRDIDCSTPLAHGMTGTNGEVTLNVINTPNNAAWGLDGYVLLQSPNIVTLLRYWGYPFSEAQAGLHNNMVAGSALQVLTPSEFQQLAQSLGTAVIPDAGSLALYVSDCDHNYAPGVQFSVSGPDAGSRTYYSMSTTATSTDSTGLGVIGPLPPGVVDVTALPLDLGKASSIVRGVIVRANALTTVPMYPTP